MPSRLTDVDLNGIRINTLFPAESRAFDTILSYPGVIAEYFIYLDFATGPAPPASAAGEPRAALLASLARERLLREQLSLARATR